MNFTEETLSRTPGEQRILEAKDWAITELAPTAETWERERRFAREAFDSAASNGLTGLLVPEEHGGKQIDSIELAKILEHIAAVDFSVAFSLVCHNNLAGAIARKGSTELKSRFLPGLVNGKVLGAFLLTEPKVGSDAAAIELQAHRDGGEWILNGEKAWVTNGTEANLLSVYAQTDPSEGHRGIATFLVEADSEGVQRLPGYQLFGGHGMGTNGIRFENCRVPDANLFLPPSQGFGAAMEGIDLARVLVSAMSCGMLRSGLETAVNYVLNRQAFGGKLSDLQGIRFMLGDVATDLEAATLLTYEAANIIAADGNAGVAAAHAKKFSTRVTEKGLAQCMQVMGANGSLREHSLSRHLAASRLTHYLDGATEIQNVVITRDLFSE